MQQRAHGYRNVEVSSSSAFSQTGPPILTILPCRNPGDSQPKKDSLEYYTWLAKLAEKGKITTIFFADVYGTDDTFPGQFEEQFRSGSNCAQLDPMIMISAMAAVSKSVCFGITGSTSYINVRPYYQFLAKPIHMWYQCMLTLFLCSLLFLRERSLLWTTSLRAELPGMWSRVTLLAVQRQTASIKLRLMTRDMKRPMSIWICATRKSSLLLFHTLAWRTQMTDSLSRLWEGSWEDGSVVFDPKTEVAYDASKVHKITFNGNHHKTAAVGAAHPSPQRTPVIFQAGQSTAGKAFAALNAEAVFVGGGKPSDTAPYVKEIRAAAAADGRDPNHIKVFPQMTPILGRTMEEAQAKYEKYRALVDWRGGLAKISQYLNVDLSKYDPEAPFDVNTIGKSDNAIHAIINTVKRHKDMVVTPRFLGEKMAFCGFGPMPVGTPEMVADVIEDWATNADIDGFNIACE